MNLKLAKRKLKLQKKVIELEVKQSIVEENRTLNDVEVERGLVYVRADLEPPLVRTVSWNPGPIMLDDDQSLFSMATSIATGCNMGNRSPLCLARKEAHALEQTCVGWLPPEPKPLPQIDKIHPPGFHGALGVHVEPRCYQLIRTA